ncbi:AAA family ATPase [Thermotoga sp. KOL6]|nr:ATP-binding protein [Thermotoga sp. KOL6]PLV59757.1 AAA family ATPase [Thermotoga sp. KOL6]
MLFSLIPKARKSDLFGREKELEELNKLINIYPIVVVTGVRRVGKSSLIKVFLNEKRIPHLIVDGRKLYESSHGHISSTHLCKVLSDELSKFSKSQAILNLLKRIRGISVSGTSLEINPKELSLTDLIERFNTIVEHQKKPFVFFFDEAQYFKYYGSRGGNDLLALFSYSHDQLENVRILITGSEIGTLHDFLKIENYKSPLYGRGVGFLNLEPFSLEQSVKFLKKGFEELNRKVNFDLEETARKMNGIPGYLVLFGIKYLETEDERVAFEEVFHTASLLFEQELIELGKRSPRYIFLLKQIAKGINTWSYLKSSFHAKGDRIGDSRLYSLLKTLERMSFVKKENGVYKIVDPILERILRD